jgi:hypothetical protein
VGRIKDTWYEILFRVDLEECADVTWRRTRRESLRALSGRRIDISGYYTAAEPCQITDHGVMGTVLDRDAHRTRADC